LDSTNRHGVSRWWAHLAHHRNHSAFRNAIPELTDINVCIHWLRTRFFAEHCDLFLQRPFLWHIWDGEPDGFGVIVRYQKLTREGLRSLIDDELIPWLSALEFGASGGTPVSFDAAVRHRL